MASLGEEFTKEQARVREVLAAYYALGPCGAFGAFEIERTLKMADSAVMSGDVAAMIATFKDLQGIQ